MKLVHLLAALSLLPLAAVASPDPRLAPVDAGLAQAKARHAPVLLDFRAPWCHSCYFMDKHVLSGAEWTAFTKKAVVVSLDTDTPEGAYWKARYKLVGVPTYVLIDDGGKELGRIVGDLPRAQFYAELARISRKDGGFAVLQALALGRGKKADAAALAALTSYHAALDGTGGLAWWDSLPPARRAALEADPRIVHEQAWLELTKAAEGQHPDGAACLKLAPPLLAHNQQDCTFAANLNTVFTCSEGLDAATRKTFFTGYRAPLTALINQRVIANPPRCSDNRDPVLLAAELATLDGDEPGKQALLAAAIAHGKRALRKGVARDKSIADNQRVFLEQAGRYQELEVLLQQLMAAYPDDYVYANRTARLLAQRGEHEKALPYFALAAEKAYGINRLRNAQEQVKSLIALNRKAEAQKLAADVLAANGPWFEEEVAKLKALLL